MKPIRPFLVVLLLIFFRNASGQTHGALQGVLEKQFPEKADDSDRWVFDPHVANIERIYKPLVKSIAKNFDFYKVTLISHLGYHINEVTCLVLFDSIRSNILLVEPLWYGGTSQSFIN